MIVHIEKALYSYEGVYPAFVMAFAKAFALMFPTSTGRMTRQTGDSACRNYSTFPLIWRPSMYSGRIMICRSMSMRSDAYDRAADPGRDYTGRY
jgi:hypothetical protein